MKRVLVTGAHSYIGTSLERYLAQWPDEYHVDTMDMVDGSWRDKSFTGYDSMFHVAGIAHIKTKKLSQSQRSSYWKVNAELPVEVAEHSKSSGVSQFIFLSSMSVYGEHGSLKHPVLITPETLPKPNDIYGQSKLSAEEGLMLLDGDGFRVCVLRPPMVYGPGCKGNYPLLEKAALRLPIFPDIKNKRSMLQIDVLCDAVKQAIDTESSGIHLPQNPAYTCTSQMVKEIAQAHGKTIRLTHAFNPLLRLLSGRVSLVDKVFGSLVYENKKQYAFIPEMVSVIMPAYNASEYIDLSLQSVLSQSYTNLELIIVDDCSTDDTVDILECRQKKDDRIRIIRQKTNSGAGAARNTAIEAARGEFIAFLDSDDLWDKYKLEKQIDYMRMQELSFTCTDYAIIDENGNRTGEVRRSIPVSDYNTVLKHGPGNSTVMYNAGKLGKFYIQPIRKRNDYVMWLAVVKRAGKLIGLNETLSCYRIHSKSLSINKSSLIKFHWIVYRDIENLSLTKTIYLMLYWLIKTAFKKVKYSVSIIGSNKGDINT